MRDESGQFILDRRRPPVSHNPGSKQGDHSTAFGLIVRTLKISVTNQDSNAYISGLKLDQTAIYEQIFHLLSNANRVAEKLKDKLNFTDNDMIKVLLNNQTDVFQRQLGVNRFVIVQLDSQIDNIGQKLEHES